MAAVVQKGEKCVWGTGEVSNPTSGIVVSASISADGQTDALEDGEGARIGLVIYDETYSGTLTVVCRQNTKAPTVGDSLTAGTMKCYVTGTRTDWQNKGKKQLTISVEGGKNLS